MKDKIQSFEFEGKEVKTLKINDEPWFVGKDLATILGYSNTRDALNKHVDSEDKNTGIPSQFATVLQEEILIKQLLTNQECSV